MKKYLKYKKFTATVGLFLMFLLPATVSAFQFTGEQSYSQGEDEQVLEDLYVGAEDISISGDVFGDLSAAGQEVFLSGTTTEDVNAAGRNVTFNGVALDDLRLAGAKVVVSGTASSSLIAAGSVVHLTPEAEIGGEAKIFGGKVRVEGSVLDDLEVTAGQVYLNGTFGGDVVIHSENITIGSGTKIAGDLKYFSQTEANIADGATIGGEVVFRPVAEASGSDFSGFGLLLGFLTLLAGALLFGLLPRTFSQSVYTRAVSASAWKYFLLGLAFVVFTPFVAIILFLTFVGIPLGILLLLAYLAFLIVAWFYAAILLGSYLWQWMQKEGGQEITWQGALLGAFLMTILSFVPLVGFAIQAVLVLIALGALLMVKYEAFKKLR